jgi:hypothetical protein
MVPDIMGVILILTSWFQNTMIGYLSTDLVENRFSLV